MNFKGITLIFQLFLILHRQLSFASPGSCELYNIPSDSFKSLLLVNSIYHQKSLTPITKLFLPLYSSQPISSSSDITSVIIVLHGLNADAYNPFCECFYSLQQYYQNSVDLKKTIIIAPLFAEVGVNGTEWMKQSDPKVDYSNYSSIYWGSSSWMSGINDYYNVTDSFTLLDSLCRYFMDSLQFPSLTKITFSGFSAGAQMISRYSFSTNVYSSKVVLIQYIMSDASTYIYLSPLRPSNSTCTQLFDTSVSHVCTDWIVSSDEIDACPSYDSYKYGISSFPKTTTYSYLAYLSNIDLLNLQVSQYRNKNLNFIFGTGDVCNCNTADFINNKEYCFPNNDQQKCSPTVDLGCCDCYPDGNTNDLSVTCEAMIQGSNRLQRGLNYMSYLQDFYNQYDYKPNYSIVSDLTHDSSKYYLSTAFTSLAFYKNDVNPLDAKLNLISDDLAAIYSAYCLDGSKGGYYFRQGSDNNKWKFHFQGGGWCRSIEECYSKSINNPLGSSLTWPESLSDYTSSSGNTAKFYGLMDNGSANENPFGSWNFVWLLYCDGSSFTSNQEEPLVYNNTKIFLRGKGILDGILYDLEKKYGFLSNAKELIISGTSAGGLAALLHSSYIKSVFKDTNSVRISVLPDAGFFLDHIDYYGEYSFRSSIQSSISVSLWNSTLGGLAGNKCLSTEGRLGSPWKCYFAQYYYKYLTDIDGIWFLQSMYDSSQLSIVYRLSCNMYSTCNSEELQAIDQYHKDIRDTLVSTIFLAFQSSRDGYYLTSCFQHEESCQAFDWYNICINNASPNETFYSWYMKDNTKEVFAIDVDWPNDISCPMNGAIHGSC